MGLTSFMNKSLLTIAGLAILSAGLAFGTQKAAAQGPNVPVFQKEVFPKTHDSAAIDEIEFEVKKGVRYFKIDINSIFPWICEGEIHNVYADEEALASHGNTWFLRQNYNVYKVAIRYFVPSNRGYCSFIVKAYQ